MTTPPEPDLEPYARQAAALIGLPIDARHLPGVVQNLRVAARAAAVLQSVPLTPTDEPAPVFVAAPR
jgi:hypothetical protein